MDGRTKEILLSNLGCSGYPPWNENYVSHIISVCISPYFPSQIPSCFPFPVSNSVPYPILWLFPVLFPARLKEDQPPQPLLSSMQLTSPLTLPVQALWLRLGSRPGYSLGLGREARQFVWQVVHSLPQVTTTPPPVTLVLARSPSIAWQSLDPTSCCMTGTDPT